MDALTIKNIISRFREIQANVTLCQIIHAQCDNVDTNESMTANANRQVLIIQAWLQMLGEEERFVIIKHLVDKLPWPMVVIEYERRWGIMQSRHERTLKRIQVRALERIVCDCDRHCFTAELSRIFECS